MAVIRTIQAQQGIDVGAPPSTRLDDSIGEGLRSVGAAVTNAAQAEMQIELRRQQMAMQNAEFSAEQEFARFRQDQAAFTAETASNIDPSGVGFTEKISEDYNKRSEAFLATIPESIRPRMGELLRTHRNDVIHGAAAKEADQRQTWFKKGVEDRGNELASTVLQDPSQYEAALADGTRLIDASGLSPIEKQAAKEGLKKTLLLSKAENYKRTDPSKIIGAGGGGVESGDPRDLLRSKEGFRASPYWDVDAYRIGYGSDTVTLADGSVRRVRQGMKITREDAERDLARRAREFEHIAASQVSTDAWARLPGSARAALVSVTYNYGELPGSVVRAVRSGDVNAIADAVAGLQNHNGGVNRERRLHEAAIIRSGHDDGTPALTLSDEFKDLSAGDRLKLYDDAIAAQRQLDTADKAKREADYQNLLGSLKLGVETGQVNSRQQILESQLDDTDKATMLRRLDERNGEDIRASELLDRIGAGNGQVNPFDSAETKVAEKAFTKAMESVDPQKAKAFEGAFVAGTGYVPKTVMADLQAGAIERDPSKFSEAMTRADMLERAAPKAFQAGDGAGMVMKALEPWRRYVQEFGLSGEDAAKRVLAANDPAKKATREQLKPALDKALKDLTVDDAAEAFDPGYFTNGPDTPLHPDQANALLADYKDLYEQAFYETNGDTTSADALASAELKKSWGVSAVTGESRVMRNPPENFYPTIGGTHDYVRENALAVAKIHAAEAGREVENVTLVPDDATRQDIELGNPPRYRLFYQFTDKTGVTRFDEVHGGHWQMGRDELRSIKDGLYENRASATEAYGWAEEDARQRRRLPGSPMSSSPWTTPGINPPSIPNVTQAVESPKIQSPKTTAGGRIAEKLPNIDPSLIDVLNNPTGN